LTGTVLKKGLYMLIYTNISDYMYTTVRVEAKTKEKLEALKEYDRETFDSLLSRLADNYPEVKDELIEEIIAETKEYEKKKNKKVYASIDELRKEIEGA